MENRTRLIIVAICIAVVAIGAVMIEVQRTNERVKVEETVRDYIGALNSYDLDEVWALMSSEFQENEGYENVTKLVEILEEKHWRGEVKEIVDTDFLLAEIKRTYQFTLRVQITTNEKQWEVAWTFLIVRVDLGVKWNPLDPGEWRIHGFNVQEVET